MAKGLMETVQRTIQVVVKDPLRALSLAQKILSKPRVPENSSFCFVREDDDVSTRIYLYNYWSENYKIDNPEIRFDVLSAEGKPLGQYSLRMNPNESACVAVSVLLQKMGIPKPFEGSVLATIASPNLVDKRPLQMNVDYFYANGMKVSSVHSQWGFLLEPVNETLASFHVDIRPGVDTHVVLRNTLKNNKRINGLASKFCLINHRGERLVQPYPDIPSLGMKRINVREYFPDAELFLDGKNGNLEVTTPTEMGRCLFYHTTRDGNYCFDHATQYLGEKEDFAYTFEQMKQMGVGTVGVGAVLVDSARETYVIPFADFYQKDTVYSLDLTLFDASGNIILVNEKVVTVKPGEAPSISFAKLLRENNIESFKGVYRLSYHLDETIPRYAKTFHTITGYIFPEGKTEYQFDSGLFNMPIHNFSNEYQTTKIFSRAIVNELFTTALFLTNPSGETGYSKTSSTQVMVFDVTGKTVGEKTIAIPANGCTFIDLNELFPSLKEDLAPSGGVGTVKVRDRTTRVVGTHFIQNRDGVWLGSDHLVGG